jgi:hypothetical protein
MHDTTSAVQLRIEKPYLSLAIQAICCKSPSRKVALEGQLCKIFAQRALVQAERSMDLLLGHMVYTASGMLAASKQALNMNSSMAAVLAQDLSLDQIPGYERSGPKSYVYGVRPPEANPRNSSNIKSLSQDMRTNEQRRAVLACYCLCSG